MKELEHRPIDVPGGAVHPKEEELHAGPSRSPQQLVSAGRASVPPVMALQRMAGNHALANLIAKEAPAPLRTTRPMRRRPTNGRASVVQRVSKKEKKKLKEVIGKTFKRYSKLSRDEASEQCKQAAQEIGEALTGYNVEYFCVCWWVEPTDNVSMSHYVVIVNREIVIDATAQQFKGQKARIESFSDWFSQLTTTIDASTLSKYIRGSLTACDSLGERFPSSYAGAPGQPLHDYSVEASAAAEKRA